MSVRVLFFGATADIVGQRELEVVAASSTELLDQLVSSYPDLGRHKLLVSVNQEYAQAAEVNDGDEVAVFTAVSGG